MTAFETGHQHLGATCRRGRAGCASGCTVKAKPLYLKPGLKAWASMQPKSGDAAFDEYVSDPAKPVPFRARPIQPVGYGPGYTLADWLVDDQREASGRPDVLAFTSEF